MPPVAVIATDVTFAVDVIVQFDPEPERIIVPAVTPEPDIICPTVIVPLVELVVNVVLLVIVPINVALGIYAEIVPVAPGFNTIPVAITPEVTAVTFNNVPVIPMTPLETLPVKTAVVGLLKDTETRSKFD